MLGHQQARIIGILRNHYETNPEKYLSIKQIHEELEQEFMDKKSPTYNTVATILKRLAEQHKIDYIEDSNRIFYRFKDIQVQEANKMLATFIHAFGTSGLAHLANATQNLSENDIKQLYDEVDEEHE